MTDAIAERGPDGVRHWIGHSIGLGHCALHTTAESVLEAQPFQDQSGEICLVLDGRVDNRRELRAAIEAGGLHPATDTDAELVALAYRLWGNESPRRVLGDFAFAIWDRRTQELFCARDPLALRPFYYYLTEHLFVFGSELRQLLAVPGVRREPNEGMIAEYLARNITSREDTLFRGIRRLKPGHLLRIGPSTIHLDRFWDVDPSRTIRYRDDDQYAEHFRELFEDAVRTRMRSHRPVGAYLSGGLDSSSVVGCVEQLRRSGQIEGRGFETFSMVFPGQPCDESSYIADVEARWGIVSNRLDPADPDRSLYADQVERYRDFPNYPNGTMSDALKALARDKGMRVLLTGNGGDQWFVGSRHHAADLLRRLQLPSLIRQLRDENEALWRPTSVMRSLIDYGLRPMIPERWRRVIRAVRGRSPVPPWLRQEFARRVDLDDRVAHGPEMPPFPTFAQRNVYHEAFWGFATHFAEVEERAASWFGVEQREPLRDRRLIEFAMAIPEEQRWQGARTKVVLRNGVRGLVPENIRLRTTKAEFSSVFIQALEKRGGVDLFKNLTIASAGWVNADVLQQMYVEMADLYRRNDRRYSAHIWPLWLVYGIELWVNMGLTDRRSA